MAAVSGPSHRSVRASRSLRLRAGVARTFGSLFLMFGLLLLVLGGELLYDAFADPLTASAAQIMFASVCLALSFLLLFFLFCSQE